MKNYNSNESKSTYYDKSRKYNYQRAGNSKDLIQMLKNNVQEMYGVDEVMVEMCKNRR